MPRADSHVIGLRTRTLSMPSRSISRACSHVIISFSRMIGVPFGARDDRRPADPAADRLRHRAIDFVALVDGRLRHSLERAAVVHRDDDVLGHVGEFARQVARVGRFQRRVGQPLAGTVRRGEVLQHAEAFAEVRLDRRLDDLAGRLGHQTTHAGELANLLDAAASAGVGHQEDRVQVRLVVARTSFLRSFHHLLGDLVAGVGPEVDDLVVALLVGDDASGVHLLDLVDFLRLRGQDDGLLVRPAS